MSKRPDLEHVRTLPTSPYAETHITEVAVYALDVEAQLARCRADKEIWEADALSEHDKAMEAEVRAEKAESGLARCREVLLWVQQGQGGGYERIHAKDCPCEVCAALAESDIPPEKK